MPDFIWHKFNKESDEGHFYIRYLISNDEKIICDHKETGRIILWYLTAAASLSHDGHWGLHWPLRS